MKCVSILYPAVLVALCLLFAGDRLPAVRRVRLVRLPSAVRHSASRAPRIRHTSGKTLNWAGYVVQTNLLSPEKHSATDVQGSWQVPAVASSGTLDTSSAIWVGLDGNSNNTVEQIGTEQDWTSGAPNYYAWFEMYPARAYMILDFPISPGDQIHAGVHFIGKNKFNLTITNLTQNAGFSVVKKRSAKRTSAEWIVEAPYYRGVLPLADFGTTTLTGCSATFNGQSGPINDSSWQSELLIMEPTQGVVAAVPSGLTADGTEFSVTWHHH